MDRNTLCRALYALPAGTVVKRRKSLFVPLLIAVAGGGLLVVNTFLEGAALDNQKSAVVFVGGTLLLVGLLWLVVRLGAQGVPYHLPSKSYMRFDELYFDRSLQSEVTGRLEAGDLDGLLRLPRQTIPAVAVMLCRTRDNTLAAGRAFAYAELEYKPLGEMNIMDKT